MAAIIAHVGRKIGLGAIRVNSPAAQAAHHANRDGKPADCTWGVNRGRARERKPHDRCFGLNNLSNGEPSGGKSILPKRTGQSWSAGSGFSPSGESPGSLVAARRPPPGRQAKADKNGEHAPPNPRKDGRAAGQQKIKMPETEGRFLQSAFGKNRLPAGLPN